MTFSPQKEFYSGPDGVSRSEDCAKLRELCEQAWFRRSLAAALAQLANSMPATELQQVSCDSWNKMVGARRLIDVLLNLTETPGKEKTSHQTLNYDA